MNNLSQKIMTMNENNTALQASMCFRVACISITVTRQHFLTIYSLIDIIFKRCNVISNAALQFLGCREECLFQYGAGELMTDKVTIYNHTNTNVHVSNYLAKGQ